MGELILCVSPTEKSFALCRRILQNLQDINAAGYRLRPVKVTGKNKKQNTDLRGVGVNSTPCLILPGGGRPIHGTNFIIQALSDMIDGPTGDNNNCRRAATYRDGDYIENYLAMSAVEDGRSRKTGPEPMDEDADWNPQEAMNRASQQRNQQRAAIDPRLVQNMDTPGNMNPANNNNMNDPDNNKPISPANNLGLDELDDNDADINMMLQQML
jgi:hypothetical protein